MKVRPAFSTALAVLFASVVFATPGWAATYYVATTGSDANPGTSVQPFRTITAAYARTAAGDTVIVKPGVYTDHTAGYGLRLNRSGTAAAPITVKSETRGAAILDGQNNSARPEVVWINGSYNILEGFEIRNGFKGGMQIYGSFNQIRHNEVHHNGSVGDPNGNYGQDGIYSDRQANGNIYWGNYVHHNGRISLDSNLDHGLYLTGDNELVANNVVTYNSAYGIHIAGYTTISNLKIYNNVSSWNGRSGIMLWQALSGVDIRNNILSNNRNYAIDTYAASGSGLTIDRNIAYGNGIGTMRLNNSGSTVSYSLGTNPTSNPQFVNPSTGDYRVQASSPAVNAGVVLSAITADYLAVPRPQGGSHDIGAHEYRGDATAPAAPANLRVVTATN